MRQSRPHIRQSRPHERQSRPDIRQSRPHIRQSRPDDGVCFQSIRREGVPRDGCRAPPRQGAPAVHRTYHIQDIQGQIPPVAARGGWIFRSFCCGGHPDVLVNSIKVTPPSIMRMKVTPPPQNYEDKGYRPQGLCPKLWNLAENCRQIWPRV